MERITTTPFGRRPLSACLLKHEQIKQQRPALPQANKYEILRLLGIGRKAFGVSDRDLSVLAALASFSHGAELSAEMNLVVFPSNRTLAERIHGMPESTLRRHVAALVKAGLILRHDSPNGKRYAVKDRQNGALRAFGFDLTPLLVRAQEIALEAEKVRVAAENLRRVREQAVLNLRDCQKMMEFAQAQGLAENWDEVSDQIKLAKRAMRRKLALTDMTELQRQTEALLERVHDVFPIVETAVVSCNDDQNERHYNNTKIDYYVSEKSREDKKTKPPQITLGAVLEACPEIQTYSQDGIRHWHHLIGVAYFVKSMMGIAEDAWDEAVGRLGAEMTALVVAAMLERIEEIKSPGGYLRALARKSEEKAFSPGAMITALLKRHEKAAA